MKNISRYLIPIDVWGNIIKHCGNYEILNVLRASKGIRNRHTRFAKELIRSRIKKKAETGVNNTPPSEYFTSPYDTAVEAFDNYKVCVHCNTQYIKWKKPVQWQRKYVCKLICFWCFGKKNGGMIMRGNPLTQSERKRMTRDLTHTKYGSFTYFLKKDADKYLGRDLKSVKDY